LVSVFSLLMIIFWT